MDSVLPNAELPLASPAVSPRSRPELRQLTTFRLGGRPAAVVDCATEAELIAAVRAADQAGRRVLVLGGGSNLVVGQDLAGLSVVRYRRGGVRATEHNGRLRLAAQAGASWDALAAWTVAQGWAALAPLSGIPGSVGALPVQNVGAYGAAASDVVVGVRAYDRIRGEVVALDAGELDFSYRDSLLKRSIQGAGGITPRWVVLEVTLDLGAFATASRTQPAPVAAVPAGLAVDSNQADNWVDDWVDDWVGGARSFAGGVPAPAAPATPAMSRHRALDSVPVGYAQLADALGLPLGSAAPGAAVREAVLKIRRAKGMVLDPADHDTWSAGSYFTNPVVTAAEAAALPPAAPRFEAGDRVKTSAAWLMSQAGVERGWGIGPEPRVTTSSKHVLALTNRGGATAAEVLALEAWIVERVRRRFGVTLTREPVLVD
ncbi:MAG: FAD-binding protein [Bifidobacteriaceae bacterium]|nr:FAD-binding protein [Bifidobacteriaceae bacterium]